MDSTTQMTQCHGRYQKDNIAVRCLGSWWLECRVGLSGRDLAALWPAGAQRACLPKLMKFNAGFAGIMKATQINETAETLYTVYRPRNAQKCAPRCQSDSQVSGAMCT